MRASAFAFSDASVAQNAEGTAMPSIASEVGREKTFMFGSCEGSGYCYPASRLSMPMAQCPKTRNSNADAIAPPAEQPVTVTRT
jgi:hypothetical protein